MGKLTVFVEDDSLQCKRVVRALKAHMLPVTAINVTLFPSKRKDMMSLSQQIMTPQVFFNTRYIGGVDETLFLLQEWDESCLNDNSTSSSNSSYHGRSSISSSSSLSGIKSPRRKAPRRSSLRNKRYATVLDRYMAEVGEHPDPMDKRLSAPAIDGDDDENMPMVMPEPRPFRDEEDVYCIRVKKEKTATVPEMTELLKSYDELSSEDNRLGGVVYKRSFLGRQLLDVLRTAFDLSNKEAAALAERLIDLQVIQLLDESAATMPGVAISKLDKAHVYRLQCYHTPDVLNSYCVYVGPVDPDSMRLLHSLQMLMESIEVKVTNELGYKDVERALCLPQYALFEEAVCELQGVDLGSMNDTTKLAFGMNLYNLMICYAHIKVGIVAGDNAMARATFLATVKFSLGGHLYSFNDWEHGILRGNCKSINSFTAPFGRKDPRYQYIVQKPDPRIHFGLSRASRSCPKSYRFSTAFLEDELAIVAANFCEDDNKVKLDMNRREICLSPIFRWYRPDFTDHEKNIPTVLATYVKGLKKQTLDRMLGDCNDAPISVVYMPFDWTCVACMNAQIFDTKVFKMEHRQGIRGLLRGTSRMSPRRSISCRTPVPISPTSIANAPFVLFHY